MKFVSGEIRSIYESAVDFDERTSVDESEVAGNEVDEGASVDITVTVISTMSASRTDCSPSFDREGSIFVAPVVEVAFVTVGSEAIVDTVVTEEAGIKFNEEVE